MALIASAPGKVFAIGEYAVVSGGPAVIATVTRRLRARVHTRSGTGQLVVHNGEHTARCALAAERIDALPPATRFVAAAALVSARALALDAVDLEVETESALDPGTAKTGLGGSAAATAATVRAIFGLVEGRSGVAAGEGARVAAGVYAHRLVQGGGSAADVIASTVGGLVWTESLDGSDVPADIAAAAARVYAGEPPIYERLALPAPLRLEVVSTGKSCATGPRVARYSALAFGSPRLAAFASLREWTDGMRAAVETFRDACRLADAGMLRVALRAAAALLSRLGAVAAVPVYTPELRRACAIAAELRSAAAKPSGAGGGDCAIAVVAPAERDELRARWQRAGLTPLALDLDHDGARLEVTT